MFGEAVVIFTPDVSDAFKYMRKQAMQLGSKMRFLSAQFAAYLAGGLWRTNAEQANRMALRLAGKISSIQGCKIVQEVQSNAVFVQMPLEAADKLAESFFFYFWDRSDSARPVIRLMCSFDTSDEDVDGLVDALGRIMQGKGPS
jgi:threonine aldolase